MTGQVELHRHGALAEIVLSQPERRNAISVAMWHRLAEIAQGEISLDVRCVIIRGQGASFSSGADITGFKQGRSGDNARTYDDLVEETVRAIEAMPMPTIAAINGPCVGAGASLACGCDLRVADDSAFFAVPAARLGLGYDPRGIMRFRRIFGDAATRQILFTAARLPALRAFQLGAVSVLASGDARDEALAIAGTIAANAPLTIRATKAMLAELSAPHDPSDVAVALAMAADASADYVEGRSAFVEKRPARFQGK